MAVEEGETSEFMVWTRLLAGFFHLPSVFYTLVFPIKWCLFSSNSRGVVEVVAAVVVVSWLEQLFIIHKLFILFSVFEMVRVVAYSARDSPLQPIERGASSNLQNGSRYTSM